MVLVHMPCHDVIFRPNVLASMEIGYTALKLGMDEKLCALVYVITYLSFNSNAALHMFCYLKTHM